MRVELRQGGQCITNHAQCDIQRRHTTKAAHMPPANREVAGCSAQTLTGGPKAVVPRCGTLVERLLAHRRRPQHTSRICMRVQSLGQKHGIDSPEVACTGRIKHSAISAISAQAMFKNRINVQREDA